MPQASHCCCPPPFYSLKIERPFYSLTHIYLTALDCVPSVPRVLIRIFLSVIFRVCLSFDNWPVSIQPSACGMYGILIQVPTYHSSAAIIDCRQSSWREILNAEAFDCNTCQSTVHNYIYRAPISKCKACLRAHFFSPYVLISGLSFFFSFFLFFLVFVGFKFLW